MDIEFKTNEQQKLRIKVFKPEEEEEIFECIGIDNAGGLIYKYQGVLFTGIIEHYYNNILVGEEGYIDGHPGGIQRNYFHSGKIKTEYHEYYAKPHGDVKIWDESGQLTHHSIYEHGKQVEILIMKKE